MDQETLDDIREWVECDNACQRRQEAVKIVRDQRKKIENKIVASIRKKNMLDSHVTLSDGGELSFQEKTSVQSLTQGMLKEQLAAFFEEASFKPGMKVDADSIYKYVLDHRRQTILTEIIRKTL